MRACVLVLFRDGTWDRLAIELADPPSPQLLIAAGEDDTDERPCDLVGVVATGRWSATPLVIYEEVPHA